MRADKNDLRRTYRNYWDYLWNGPGMAIPLGGFTYLYYIWNTVPVCQHCGSQIPESVKVCPICKVRQD